MVVVCAKAEHNMNFEHSYPRLYFSMQDVPKLRAQATSSHSKIYKNLAQHLSTLFVGTSLLPPVDEREFNSRWNEFYGNILGKLALYCTLTPDDDNALRIATLFMDRLTSYNSWLVTSKPRDEVPLSHSLLGYVISFDFLHHSFTQRQRERYAEKILKIGTQLYEASYKAWWGKAFIHNHVATNYLSLLAAAVVIKPYHPSAYYSWQERSVRALNSTMEILKLVVDGSFQEGVSYGSYTMRSLTQFALISQRHFNFNLTSNYWLKKHLDFLLYTIIPGFEFTVGFADSNLNWAYGPGSQLYFLDSYVLKDGRAMWLANTIKHHSKDDLSITGKSLLATEYLFYNGTRRPKPVNKVRTHVFSDWGVVTFGGGYTLPRSFLAFKCSHVHGRAVNMLRRALKEKVGFTPGHEQPDQGSFVFITKDQAVVTESRYAPKYTFLQNTLMFGPSKDGCTPPYVGQLGECFLWLNHKSDPRTWLVRGEILGYSHSNDIIFMNGDMTSAYDKDLGLSAVYRSLILLRSNVLLIIDIVHFHSNAKVSHVSTFFHNSHEMFTVEKDKRPCRVKIGQYNLCWEHLNGKTDDITIRNKFSVKKMRYETNFVNITWRRSASFTSTVYLFHGPEYNLYDFKMSKIAHDGLSVGLTLNSHKYHVVLPTKFNDPLLRVKLLDSYAFGKVYHKHRDDVSVSHLGLNGNALNNDDIKSLDDPELTSLLCANPLHEFGVENIAIICVLLLFLCLNFKFHFQYLKRLFVFSVFLFIMILTHLFFSNSPTMHDFSPFPCTQQARHRNFKRNVQKNAVLITGLPLSGVELAREIFTTNVDFITIGVSSKGQQEDGGGEVVIDHQMYEKLRQSNFDLPEAARITKEYITLANPLKVDMKNGIFVEKSHNAIVALCVEEIRLLLRTLSLQKVKPLTPLVYVVRDPKSWIVNMLRRPVEMNLFMKDFEMLMSNKTFALPYELHHLGGFSISSMKNSIVMAHIWSAVTELTLKLASSLPREIFKIVRFDDIVLLPKATAGDVYNFLGMPFRPAVEHRIVQVTKSGLYHFKKYGTIEPTLPSWSSVLSSEEVKEIERICGKTTKIIYDRNFPGR